MHMVVWRSKQAHTCLSAASRCAVASRCMCSTLTAVDASAYPGVCCDYVLFGLQRWAAVPEMSASAAFWGRALTSVVLTLTICAINMAGIKLATWTAVALAITIVPH